VTNDNGWVGGVLSAFLISRLERTLCRSESKDDRRKNMGL
jgi:hypothetical protein